MKLIDGRELAKTIRTTLTRDVDSSGLQPKLAALLVGEDPASALYVSMKEKAAREAGIATDIRRLPADAGDAELIALIESWNADETVDAILVQLPLPPNHDTDAVIAAIDPRKDADGFHPKNVESLISGNGRIIPPLHEGILRLIGATDVAPNTATAAVIANSEAFSKPLTYLLEKAGSNVTTMPPDELDRKALALANIVVIAIGRPGFLRRGMVSADACIIDVGTNKTPGGKTVGDVDTQSLADLPGWLSPVPGGVGPMTIALLLQNVFNLAKMRRGLA